VLDRSKLSKLEKDLVEGLEEFVTDLKSGKSIEKKYIRRRVVLDLEPGAYTPQKVKEVRQILNVSQLVFAQFLGVTVKAVSKWESGSSPNKMACRMMDEIRCNPDFWRKRLKAVIKLK
jgi:putative transcriptional regulator